MLQTTEWVQGAAHSEQILLESTGHFIQREQPEVVVAAIRQMVETIRRQAVSPIG